MSRIVDIETIFLGIEVNLVLAILDGVDVVLDIIEAVFEEGAEEAGPLGLCYIRFIFSGGDQCWPETDFSVFCY